MCVCVYMWMCVHACVRACVRACVCVCVYMCMCLVLKKTDYIEARSCILRGGGVGDRSLGRL